MWKMKLKQKGQKLTGILIVSMVCMCFAGCKGNSEEKDPVALGNQNMEESNDEQASAENMMEEETNVVAEDESEDEVTEEVSFDGYEFIGYDSFAFDRTKQEKDIIAFNIPDGFEPMFSQEINGVLQERRFDIGDILRFQDKKDVYHSYNIYIGGILSTMIILNTMVQMKGEKNITIHIEKYLRQLKQENLRRRLEVQKHIE